MCCNPRFADKDLTTVHTNGNGRPAAAITMLAPPSSAPPDETLGFNQIHGPGKPPSAA
jgi:hypothetical protein